jgi:dihydropteroate synthase
MSDKIYLRPAAFLWGRTAQQAATAGQALSIAGGPTACPLFEIIVGTAQKSRREFVSARDLSASSDPDLKHALSRICAQRNPVAGLSWDRPRVMGIVNVTPDSFSDGGDFDTAEKAGSQIARIADEGADLIDIGGESTRPGAALVDEAEELRRVLPAIEAAKPFSRVISIDTRKSAVMKAALQSGAAIINDVSALTFDGDAATVAAQAGAPVVLMHARGDPRTMQDAPAYDDVLLDVYDYLEARIEAATNAGIAREKLIADPGIGFGKTLEHNLALLSGIGLFHGLGVPLMIGVSRKRSIGALIGESDPKKRAAGSIGAALAGAAQGVQILRVHDVRETVHALTCWQASVMN